MYTDLLATSREDTLASLTLEEKAGLTSGADFWRTKSIQRAGVPGMLLTDGPHGVRRQADGEDHIGLNVSVPATCFPPAVALGSTWDPVLLTRVGEALGEEARAEAVAVLLGPGINIKRSPLGGRNFEYLSEDPLLTGVLGTALVNGVQSKGVGASLKHFAVNNQEHDRLRVSAEIDDRPLHEIYLRGFRKIIMTAKPWTVMCSYNRINGTYASESSWLLTHVLRDDWGYEGLVVSDWGAVSDRVAALTAGLDLEMPSSGGISDAQIVEAVKSGRLDVATLDTAVSRVLALAEKTTAGADPDASYDPHAHHTLALEAARRSIVLLKNRDNTLPLDAGTNGTIAVIGEYARTPRYQGGGSSLVNPTRLENALDAIRATAAAALVEFAPGYIPGQEATNSLLEQEAADLARDADTVILFLGSDTESEGYDRTGIELPASHLNLLTSITAANPNTIVVLSNGGVLQLTGWDHKVPAVLEAWLLGQAGGQAIADILFGQANPSGRLAESIPHRLQDTPAYLDFPGEYSRVRYGEGLFVGYRYYDARDLDVAYPFGHGLSYTSFSYGAPTATATPEGIEVVLELTNIGERAGHEVVQAYTSLPESLTTRPRRELKAFTSVHLEQGQTSTVTITIERDDLAIYHPILRRWVIEAGDYQVEVGASSRDLRHSATVHVQGDAYILPLTQDSTLDEWLAHPTGGSALSLIIDAASRSGNKTAAMLADPESRPIIGSFPLTRLATFPNSPVSLETIEALLSTANSC